jgi:hypothetical protein
LGEIGLNADFMELLKDEGVERGRRLILLLLDVGWIGQPRSEDVVIPRPLKHGRQAYPDQGKSVPQWPWPRSGAAQSRQGRADRP